jgi:hypothetical protein
MISVNWSIGCSLKNNDDDCIYAGLRALIVCDLFISDLTLWCNPAVYVSRDTVMDLRRFINEEE